MKTPDDRGSAVKPMRARVFVPEPNLLQPRLSRCPHCGVANPLLIPISMPSGLSQLHIYEGANGERLLWAIYWCRSCAGVITMQAPQGFLTGDSPIMKMFPATRDPAADLPGSARRYLKQAYDSIGSPDAAVLMASSAVDAMLKTKGYKEGSLNSRINEARKDGLLTPDMSDWAHEVRLVSNDTRHADEENPHATVDQALQVVEFAEALGEFLFVLPARIKRARTGGGKP